MTIRIKNVTIYFTGYSEQRRHSDITGLVLLAKTIKKMCLWYNSQSFLDINGIVKGYMESLNGEVISEDIISKEKVDSKEIALNPNDQRIYLDTDEGQLVYKWKNKYGEFELCLKI